MFLGECLCLVPVFLSYLYHRIMRRARESQLRKSGVGLYAPIASSSPRNSTERGRSQEGAGIEEQQSLLPAIPAIPAMRRSMSESRGRMDAAVEEHGEEMTAAAAFLFFAPALCDICGTTLVSERSIQSEY